MSNHPYHFDEVTLLVTHYNRSASLERLLLTFKTLGCSFAAIVVSDDGSQSAHQLKLKELQTIHDFDLITTPINKGLGNNINKGQDAVKTPYTLYIQEDFVPKPSFVPHFSDALDIMKNDNAIDTVRFYAYFKYPYTKPYKKGFSEMIFHRSILYSNHLKFYCYSDHPHLRRSNFFEKFGRYAEGIKGDLTEFDMALSFIKNKGKGLLYDDITGIIDQSNSTTEPSTMQRSNWRESNNLLAQIARSVYLKFRLLKNTWQLATYRKDTI
jgi:glycosyltransferase involved in cell wall biosynthesis